MGGEAGVVAEVAGRLIYGLITCQCSGETAAAIGGEAGVPGRLYYGMIGCETEVVGPSGVV